MLTGTTRSTLLTSAAHAALVSPALSSAQIARIAARGVLRPTTRGEVLIEGGQTDVPFFVVKAGEIEVIRPSGLGDLLVAAVHADQFTGDITMILGPHVFLMTGAETNTAWLKSRVMLDAKVFIKTGPDLTQEDLAAARWPLERSPYLLETSLPGVFAVGDVRCGNIKRVASAVGGGSIAVSFVHRVLAEYVEGA